MNLPSKTLAAALLAAAPSWFAGSADAAPLAAPLSLQDAASPAVQTVQWRGGYSAAPVVGSGYGAGYYGYGYDPGYYSYGYDPGYNSYGYDYGYADRDVTYCEQRYRSYDPASGTYLGYDGLRHPCP
jgi:hypothetical protein